MDDEDDDITPEDRASTKRMLGAANDLKMDILEFIFKQYKPLELKLVGTQEVLATVDFAMAQAFMAHIMVGSADKPTSEMNQDQLQECKNEAFVRAVGLLRGIRVNGSMEPE